MRDPAWIGSLILNRNNGSCSTLQQDNSGSYDADYNTTFYTYLSGQFTTGSSDFSACRATLKLNRSGSLSGTLQVKIYTNNGGNPGILIGAGSATIDPNTVPAVEDYVEFTGLLATLSSSTSYFVVLQASSAFITIKWIGHTGSFNVRGSTDGTSWDALGSTAMDFKLYSN